MNKSKYHFLAFFNSFILSVLIFGCSKQKKFFEEKFVPKVPLFLEMPKNPLVYENISPIVYNVLWNQFNRAGYDLKTNKEDAYRLSIKIKALEENQRLVSPDILTYGFRLKLILDCKLFDISGNLLDSKKFDLQQWVFKSNNPSLHQLYLNEQYKDLLERSAPKIDHYFRKHFIEK